MLHVTRPSSRRRSARPGLLPPVLTAIALLATCAQPAPATAAAAGAATQPGSSLRRTLAAFGGEAAVEVRDLAPDAAAMAVAAAFEEIREVESLAGWVAGEGAPATGKPVRVDPRLARLLDRARVFCLWSQGAHGPLGGRLYRLWGVGGEPAGRPTPAALAAAVESAHCQPLEVDAAGSTITLPEGSALDLTGFAAGFAADRAADALRAAGAANAVIEVGTVVRAFGPGPEGDGWAIELPAFPGTEGPLARLRLSDQAVAVAAAGARPLIVGGDRYAPFIDQRTGRPAEGVVATVAATELAFDAEALAVTAFILGSREATFLLGRLRPDPAILWLLGSGHGRPLMATYKWSQLATF